MVLETFAFALIGLVVGAGALARFPEYFAGRALTVSTAVVAALLGGRLTGYVLDEGGAVVQFALSALASALLVSVLARPDRVRRGSHRRHA
ncbi:MULTISPECIES: hypothetical protein [Kitasatospora]|uniref:GlsB/YeaQ/YmgE family stress response membrane protein n=2 Tax=Kitasatospora TaxID=2063 RepID=A0ABT1IQS6_9ACTN|nr:hypothetical protein [Kitasatospora paracochleata]MCP2307452.1 hypothetical protein [Kitasatospora paracochleata]